MEGVGLASVCDKDDAGGEATGIVTMLGLAGDGTAAEMESVAGGANVDAAAWACEAGWDFK